MTGQKIFDGEIDRIGGVLKAMREAFEPPAGLLAEAAGNRVLPDEAQLAGTEERLKAAAPELRTAEAAVARLVAGLAVETGIRRSEFDNREQPTRSEKLIGYVSKAAMRRRREARWRRAAPLDDLLELLRRSNLLTGLVKTERDILLAQRTKSEGDLVTFIEGRPYVIGRLRSEIGGAMTRVDAARCTERGVTVFQGFIDVLNRRVRAFNVLLHKLMTDTEDLLILYRAISEAVRHDDDGLAPEFFPNLAAGIERFTKGMLTVRGLDRRREHTDRAFAEWFSADAAEKGAGEVQPAKTGLLLPVPARLKFSRS